MKRRPQMRAFLVVLTAVLLLGLAACGGSGGDKEAGQTGAVGSTAAASAGTVTPQRGGSLVVLNSEAGAGAWPTGLDPATATKTNFTQMQAIYGGLFLLRSDKDGSNGHIVGNQAASGTLSPDAKTLTVKLRPGITFSDGTPLNAKAVIWNWERGVREGSALWSENLRKTNPFTSPDPLTVQAHFAKPAASALHHFPDINTNWIASPTAVKKMGEKKFRVKPVGAGPFIVVSDIISSKLVLKRNPNYFRKGLPYLDKLTFQSIGGDQAAYQALLSGQADVFEAATAKPVIEQAQENSKLQVTVQPGTAPFMVQLDTLIPPFNNKKAREAIYYATDWDAINKGLFDGKQTVVQGFTTPAGLYYNKTTPGYRTYDLDKAKQLVKELGGLSFRLDSHAGYTYKLLITALQTQWAKAGIEVELKTGQINTLIKRYNSGKWQAVMQTCGAWDPGVGLSVNVRFGSDSQFTGVKDKHLDALLKQADSTAVDAERNKIYQELAKYLSDQAYAPFGFAVSPAQFVVDGVHGPGLTTKIPPIANHPGVPWGEVWREQD